MANMCQLPPKSSRIKISNAPSHISITPLGLYLSSKILFSILSRLHTPPCLGKIFKSIVFRLLEYAFEQNKNWNWTFLLVLSQAKFSPRLKEITHLPRQCFFWKFKNVSPQQKGRGRNWYTCSKSTKRNYRNNVNGLSFTAIVFTHTNIRLTTLSNVPAYFTLKVNKYLSIGVYNDVTYMRTCRLCWSCCIISAICTASLGPRSAVFKLSS